MAKKVKNWLTPAALDQLSEVWQERVLVLLQDLSELPHLHYTYVISKDGEKYSETIGLGAKIVKQSSTNAVLFSHLARIVEEFLNNLDHPYPAHLLIELSNELLFVGSTGDVILVAAFDGDAPRGYMSMKLNKRVGHLRKMFRSMEKAAYV